MAQAPVPANLVAEIQNMFYDQNMTKAEIARQTGMSYTTVAKYIPVRAGYLQRCSNKELAERQLAVKKPAKKTEAETPVGKTFTVKKPAEPTMKIRQPMAELPDPDRELVELNELIERTTWRNLCGFVHFVCTEKQRGL